MTSPFVSLNPEDFKIFVAAKQVVLRKSQSKGPQELTVLIGKFCNSCRFLLSCRYGVVVFPVGVLVLSAILIQ